MKTKFKKRMKNRFLSAIFVFIGMFFIAGCSATWYGTGHVVDKNYMPAGYRPVTWDTKNQWLPECYELVVREQGTKNIQKGCVSERVWNDAMLDHQITLTKDYS